jgi:GTP cyclohydrolase I
MVTDGTKDFNLGDYNSKIHIKKILEYIGENPDREGLKDTPKRVVNSWKEIYGGYTKKAEDILKVGFKEFGNYDELIILKDCEFYSTCEHHMLPFFGKVSIAYLPSRKVVGISKLARLVDMHANRLQIQEKMTADIANDIKRILKPRGVAVIVEAQHFCMKARGVRKRESLMVTSSMLGSFRTNYNLRQEFLQLIKG